MTKARPFEYLMDFDNLGMVISKREMFTVIVPSAGD
jgi:hypothetical protein